MLMYNAHHVQNDMVKQNKRENSEAGVIQNEILEDSEKYLLAFQAIADKIFNCWVKLID